MDGTVRQTKSLATPLPVDWESTTPWQKLCVYKVNNKARIDCDVVLRNVAFHWLDRDLPEWTGELSLRRTQVVNINTTVV